MNATNESADVENADLREAVQTPPLFADVVFVSNDDDVLQLGVVVIAGSQWHDEVAKSDERGLGFGEQTHDNVVAQHRLCRLVAILQSTRPHARTVRTSILVQGGPKKYTAIKYHHYIVLKTVIKANIFVNFDYKMSTRI